MIAHHRGHPNSVTDMPIYNSIHGQPARIPPGRCVVRERVLLGMMVFALARSGTALCEDESTFKVQPRGWPDLGLVGTSVPGTPLLPESALGAYAQDAFAAPPLANDSRYSSEEFRPRRPSIYESADRETAVTAPPLMRSTTVLQQLSEYRARDRVRVLTLWESGASTVSLQAGKKGAPSLQWTSRRMNRGGATRGLLDRLLAVSIAGASNGLRGGSRTASGPQTGSKLLHMEASGKQ